MEYGYDVIYAWFLNGLCKLFLNNNYAKLILIILPDVVLLIIKWVVNVIKLLKKEKKMKKLYTNLSI